MGEHNPANGTLVSIVITAVLLGSVFAAVPAAGATTGVSSDQAAATDALQENDTADDVDTYAVSQGGNCVEVVPYGDGSESVEEFYRYGLHWGQYSSQGTLEMQDVDESQLLIHDGSEGASIVFVHAEVGSERGGGKASVTLTDVSPDSEWAVRDDNYTYNNSDSFSKDGREARADWVWEENRTDGGAYRGLEAGDYEAVTIEPGFNVNARHGSLDTPLAIDVWRLRSADGETVQLALNEPVTVRPGSCEGVSTVVTTDSDDRYNATARNTVESDNVTFDTSLTAATDGVTLDRATVDHADGRSWYQLQLRASNESVVPDGSAPEEPLLFVESNSPQLDDSRDGVQYAVDLDAETLAEQDVRVSDVAMFQYRDGEWHRLDHRTDRQGDTWELRSTDADGFGPVAITELQPDFRTQDVTVSESKIDVGETVEITATLVNEGGGNGTHTVGLTMFGETVDQQSVAIPPGETREVTFTRTVESPGTYTIEVGNGKAELRVEGDGSGENQNSLPSSGSIPTELLAGGVIALLIVVGVGYRTG
ncbi:CARDB domain-containing protein [Halostella sp. PRR32]|uniref:CARDB domain-containing protein n=1 Tax=Halostella sp. PRR32 TaxID=3098147 RepID=UPI002B1E3E6A|nr:CARDB domain-containing protein [Halostella sp. PRR32]